MVDGGHGSDGAPAGAGRVPIVLVCSTSDLELADETAAGLRTRGYDVAVLGAAETGADRLAEVVERFHRQGLYVLCRGGELDRDGVDALRGTLRTMDVPFGRTLTLSTQQGGARGLEERVVSVARRMVTGRFDRATPGDDTDEPAPMAPEMPSAPGVDQGDVARWADSLSHGVMLDPGLSEDLPTAVVGDAGETSGLHHGPETNPSVAAGPEPYEPIDRTLVTHHPITSATEREESSAPSPAPASMPEDDDISASAFSTGPNLRLIVGGGVALLLIVVLAIAFSGSDEPAASEPTTRDEVAVRNDAEPTPEAKQPEAKDAAEPEPEPEPEPDAPEADEAAAAEPAPEEPVAVVDEALAELDLEGAEKSLAHRSAVDVALLDDRPLPPSAPEDRAAIAQALEEREIRSWDAFLIAGEEAPSMKFKDAETYCKTLTAGNITGWRLPSIGELLSLAGAKMLDRKGVFWSETPGDAFGDTRIVVNAKKNSTSPVSTDWDGARPICVRVRE